MANAFGKHFFSLVQRRLLVPFFCAFRLPVYSSPPMFTEQPKVPPQAALQFSVKDEAKMLRGRAPVCYFCKGDTDDPESVEGAFIRVRHRTSCISRFNTWY